MSKMKSLRIETKSYGWINRFRLLKDKKEGFILKISQYKLKDKDSFREIHIWGNKSVEKLRDFLKEEVK